MYLTMLQCKGQLTDHQSSFLCENKTSDNKKKLSPHSLHVPFLHILIHLQD